MPTAHRTTILVTAVLGIGLLLVAFLATTGLIIWEPSTSADILLYNLSGVLLISALACHLGCRLYHRCASIEARQARIENQQHQIATEVRQLNALLQVLVTRDGDVGQLADAIGKRLDDLAEAQWGEGFTAGVSRTKIAPFPRTPIGRG